MAIESIQTDDIPDIIRLWHSIPDINAALGESDKPAELKRFLSRNSETCFLLRENGRIVGTVLGGYDGRRGYIYHLAVHPAFQRRGFGRALLNAVIQKFREMKVSKVHLFVFRDNHPAIEFYRHVGWTERADVGVFSFDLTDVKNGSCSC